MRSSRYFVVFVLLLAGGAWLVACGERKSKTASVAHAVSKAFWKPDPQRIPSHLATNPGTPWGDYLGSAACQSCHEEEHRRWRLSFHSRTMYDAVEETVFGDFSGDSKFDDPAYPVVVQPYTYEDPATGLKRFYMNIRWRRADEGGPTSFDEMDTYGSGELPALVQGTFEVRWSFGNRRDQPYVARWPSGRYWVLPIHWSDTDKAWRYAGFRPYVRACANCHVTGIKTSSQPNGQPNMPLTLHSDGIYSLPPGEEGWADGAVGCENCHGPGRKHVVAVNEVGVDAYRSGHEPTIWNGSDAEDELHLSDACGRCHNFFTESSCAWIPGPQGYTRDPQRWPIQLDDQTKGWQFYEDGSHMSPCTVVEVYRKTKMYAQGIGCAECHDPHGTENWADLTDSIEGNVLCLRCHDDAFPDIAAQEAHSKHRADRAGNLCVECHMPRHMAFSNGVHVMSARIYSHEFSIPTGNRAENGPPPACNVCHTDKDNAWTRKTIKRLWAAEK